MTTVLYKISLTYVHCRQVSHLIIVITRDSLLTWVYMTNS